MAKQMELSDLDTLCGKMFLESSHLKTEEISKQCLKRLSPSKKKEYAFLDLRDGYGNLLGAYWEMIFQSPIEHLMLSISESPKIAVESSLSQILMDIVPEKYYLSTKCCTGILRRTKAKNKELPKPLKYALMMQSGVKNELNTEDINDIILVMGSQQANAGIDDKICQTITATAGTGGNNQPIVLNTKTKAVFENHSQDLRFKGPLKNSPTITVGGNHTPFVSNIDKTYSTIANLLERDSKNESEIKEDEMLNLTTNDIHAVYNKKHYVNNIGCLSYGDFREPNPQYVGQGKCILSTVEFKNRDKINLVRRITPLECERLQGFPDDFTNIENCTDNARYKALGNSVAIPCVEYIMGNINKYMQKENKGKNKEKHKKT